MERNDVRMTWPKGNYRGYPPPPSQWVHVFVYGKKSWREWAIGPGIGINKVERSGEVTFMLCAVTMKYRGLVNPKDKPFGRVLPFEVQRKIMFWVDALSPWTSERSC